MTGVLSDSRGEPYSRPNKARSGLRPLTALFTTAFDAPNSSSHPFPRGAPDETKTVRAKPMLSHADNIRYSRSHVHSWKQASDAIAMGSPTLARKSLDCLAGILSPGTKQVMVLRQNRRLSVAGPSKGPVRNRKTPNPTSESKVVALKPLRDANTRPNAATERTAHVRICQTSTASPAEPGVSHRTRTSTNNS
jgi:hypothetical protein